MKNKPIPQNDRCVKSTDLPVISTSKKGNKELKSMIDSIIVSGLKIGRHKHN